MISSGLKVPWRVSRRRIVTSVIEPLPWWPLIATPLIFERSTEEPLEPAESTSLELVFAPQASPETVGFSPEAARNSTTASTRRSISPASMSRRPQV